MSNPKVTRLNQKIDAIVEQYVPQRIPCVALAVQKDEHRILERYYGWVDPEVKRFPTGATTHFDLASLTKVFVTTTFLKLVERGKIGLDDPLASVIPLFGGDPRPIDGGQDPYTQAILPTDPAKVGKTVAPNTVTFRHLLTHTSGLPPWRDVYNAVSDNPPPPPYQNDPLAGERWGHALPILCRYPFVSHPDGIVRYSDIGMMLLGRAVLILAQLPLDLAFERYVYGTIVPLFRPMKAWYNPKPLEHSEIAPTEYDVKWRKRRIWGEVHDENASALGGMSGHAGLFGTLEQVAYFGARWLNNHLQLPKDLYQIATTEQAETNGERRGLGWMIKAHQGSSAGELLSPQTFGHTGFTGTSLFIDPINRLVITLLTNAVYYGRDIMPSVEFRRAIHTAIAEELLS